jgi:hypothetical protein
MDNLEPGADNEDFVGLPDSPAELIANARARIDALEAKVVQQVDQYADTCLAASLAEAERLSIVLRDTDKERASRREAAKRKASRWRADFRRPSGILGLFSSKLRKVTGHIDGLRDKGVQASLMEDLAFLLHVVGSMDDQLMESESNGQNALKHLNNDRTGPPTKARRKRKEFRDERVRVRAEEYRARPGISKRSTPESIAEGIIDLVNSDLKAMGMKEIVVDAIATRLRKNPTNER